MTFSKTLSPNICGTFENHQNILVFPLKFEFQLAQFVYFHFEWLITKVSQSLEFMEDCRNFANFFPQNWRFAAKKRRLRGPVTSKIKHLVDIAILSKSDNKKCLK